MSKLYLILLLIVASVRAHNCAVKLSGAATVSPPFNFTLSFPITASNGHQHRQHHESAHMHLCGRLVAVPIFMSDVPAQGGGPPFIVQRSDIASPWSYNGLFRLQCDNSARYRSPNEQPSRKASFGVSPDAGLSVDSWEDDASAVLQSHPDAEIRMLKENFQFESDEKVAITAANTREIPRHVAERLLPLHMLTGQVYGCVEGDNGVKISDNLCVSLPSDALSSLLLSSALSASQIHLPGLMLSTQELQNGVGGAGELNEGTGGVLVSWIPERIQLSGAVSARPSPPHTSETENTLQNDPITSGYQSRTYTLYAQPLPREGWCAWEMLEGPAQSWFPRGAMMTTVPPAAHSKVRTTKRADDIAGSITAVPDSCNGTSLLAVYGSFHFSTAATAASPPGSRQFPMRVSVQRRKEAIQKLKATVSAFFSWLSPTPAVLLEQPDDRGGDGFHILGAEAGLGPGKLRAATAGGAPTASKPMNQLAKDPQGGSNDAAAATRTNEVASQGGPSGAGIIASKGGSSQVNAQVSSMSAPAAHNGGAAGALKVPSGGAASGTAQKGGSAAAQFPGSAGALAAAAKMKDLARGKAPVVPLPAIPDPMAVVQSILDMIMSIIRGIIKSILMPLLDPILEFLQIVAGDAIRGVLMGGEPSPLSQMMDMMKQMAMQAAQQAIQLALKAAQSAAQRAQASAMSQLNAFTAKMQVDLANTMGQVAAMQQSAVNGVGSLQADVASQLVQARSNAVSKAVAAQAAAAQQVETVGAAMAAEADKAQSAASRTIDAAQATVVRNAAAVQGQVAHGVAGVQDTVSTIVSAVAGKAADLHTESTSAVAVQREDGAAAGSVPASQSGAQEERAQEEGNGADRVRQAVEGTGEVPTSGVAPVPAPARASESPTIGLPSTGNSAGASSTVGSQPNSRNSESNITTPQGQKENTISHTRSRTVLDVVEGKVGVQDEPPLDPAARQALMWTLANGGVDSPDGRRQAEKLGVDASQISQLAKDYAQALQNKAAARVSENLPRVGLGPQTASPLGALQDSATASAFLDLASNSLNPDGLLQSNPGGKNVGAAGPGGVGSAISDAVLKELSALMPAKFVEGFIPTMTAVGGDSISAGVSSQLSEWLNPRLHDKVRKPLSDALSARVFKALLSQLAPLIPKHVQKYVVEDSIFLPVTARSIISSTTAALAMTLNKDPRDMYVAFYCHAYGVYCAPANATAAKEANELYHSQMYAAYYGSHYTAAVMDEMRRRLRESGRFDARLGNRQRPPRVP